MLINSADFPNLHAGNHRDTSPATRRYNCIAWVVGRNDEWWDPVTSAESDKKCYWPATAPRDYAVTSLVVAFKSVGFVNCADGSHEAGIEKIAIFADGPEYTHAALQLETGMWTSKLGELEDVQHDAPDDLAGPVYGHVTVFMKRKRLESAAPSC